MTAQVSHIFACRLGQTRQVTVYRLICKGTIEERILQRAREKSEIHKMVIQGGSFKGAQKSGSDLKPKEVVSLLLDDEEIETRVRMKVEEEQEKTPKDKVEVRKTRKRDAAEITKDEASVKKVRTDIEEADSEDEEEGLAADPKPLFDFAGDKIGPKKVKGRGGGKRGRPRGSGRGQGRAERGGQGGQ